MFIENLPGAHKREEEQWNRRLLKYTFAMYITSELWGLQTWNTPGA